MRDAAAFTLAFLISSCDFQLVAKDARSYMNYLLENVEAKVPLLSIRCLTNCFMFMLKHNELAEHFVDKRGFPIMRNLLMR